MVSTEWLRAIVTPVWFGAIGAGAFLVKMILMMWLQLVIRWLLPRFRYDQIQQLCWKILLPASLVNIFVTGAAILIDPSLQLLAWIGLGTIVVIGVLVGRHRPLGARAARRTAATARPTRPGTRRSTWPTSSTTGRSTSGSGSTSRR